MLALRERAKVFKALGHPARLAIAERLGVGACCVCDLQKLLELRELSGPSVSQHLLVLKSAGVIAPEKRGIRIYYRLRMPCVTEISLCVCQKELARETSTS
jgi:ArsR family transcriptional regulator